MARPSACGNWELACSSAATCTNWWWIHFLPLLTGGKHVLLPIVAGNGYVALLAVVVNGGHALPLALAGGRHILLSARTVDGPF